MQVLFNIRLRARPDDVSYMISTSHAGLVRALRQGDIEQCTDICKEVHARVATECINLVRSLNEDEKGT
jgi:hypothetical protein